VIVETPLDDAAHLCDIRLGPHTQAVDDRSECIQHNLRVLRRLLLETEHDSVHQLLLKLRVDVRHTLIGDDLLQGLHKDLSV